MNEMRKQQFTEAHTWVRAELDRCVNFWLKNGMDPEFGGVYTCLDRTGKIYSTDKSVWMQGRCGWIFAHLCTVYGTKPEWLDASRSCLDFMERHCFNHAAGDRMYFTVTKDGQPLRQRRYCFSEAFCAMANAEYYAVTGDESRLARARQMGVPVIYVCDRHYKNDPELQLWNNHMMAGSYGVQIIDEVKPDPADIVVYKNRFNGFVNTTLEKKLRQMQINTVIMTGWRSDVCVAQTAIEAFYRGFRVAIADDGVDSTTEAEHRQGMQLLAINYNFDFSPCETILENLLQQE